MSMLAEPRKKQKWSVDPRNSAWSKDDNKFGQKMLERMGWSKGKGLGRTEQGATEHIKVKVKNDGYGLGANTSHEDNWIAHQDDFNELLAQLNNCHGQNSNNEPPPEVPKGFSLEEKSKTAKKRVHYMKFTKGKDLSSRSKTDLDCIFGKRGHSSKEQEQESSSSDSQEEKEETVEKASFEQDTESNNNTVTSTLSMQEYFAQRMANLKKARGKAQNSDSSENSGENSPVHIENSENQPKKKKKKGKKEQRAAEEEAETIVLEEHTEPEQANPQQKKKKRKTQENERPLTPEEEEMPPPKKKKSKKNKDKKDSEVLNGQVLVIDDDVENEEDDCVLIEETTVEKKDKKDKKKKKKRAKESE